MLAFGSSFRQEKLQLHPSAERSLEERNPNEIPQGRQEGDIWLVLGSKYLSPHYIKQLSEGFAHSGFC